MKQHVLLRVLSAEADRDALRPILDALKEKGLRVSAAEGSLKKGEILLAALSGHFYADGEKQKTLLEALSTGAENVLPLKLDEAEIPEALMNALYTRNIIMADGRDASLIAERVLSAIPEKKSALPKLLIAGAAVLAVLAGLLIWRNSTPPVELEPTPEPTPEPTQEITVPIPAGMTAEDLEKIWEISIVGDTLKWRTEEQLLRGVDGSLNRSEIAYDSWDGERQHYYSIEDGHEFESTAWDLDFLRALPNLRSLTLILVDADALPDLGALSHLERVDLSDCSLRDVSGLKGSSVNELGIWKCPVSDYSALTGCEKLRRLGVDLFSTGVQADFSAFTPKLNRLHLENIELAPGSDFSSFAAQTTVNEVFLRNVPVTDLSLVGSAKVLTRLDLFQCEGLRDIRVLENAERLTALRIENSPQLEDFSPVSHCSMLEEIHLREVRQLRDASFLQNLKRLRDIELSEANLQDLNFLEGLTGNGTLNLSVSGDVQDYSGLSAISHYGRLMINPRTRNNPNGNLAQILEILQGPMINSLTLDHGSNLDLSALPLIANDLELRYCDIRDLSGLKDRPISRLRLYNCPLLSSLEGLQNQTQLGKHGGTLEIYGCPRLTDWSALEGLPVLNELSLYGCFTLPDFTKLHLKSLHLESIEELDSIAFIPSIDTDGKSFNRIELVELEELRDLSPLRNVRINMLTVPPHLGEQAQELKDAGAVNSYEIAFPDGSWQPMDESFTLLSLDELETLPKSLLKRVERLRLAGDTVVGDQAGWLEDEWDNGKPVPYWYDPDTDERTKIEPGSITDLGILADLTGLRELELICEPLESLDGIQNLGSLESLQLEFCPNLTDGSAAFALQDLRGLHFNRCPIESIQGVQNLPRLKFLNIAGSQVADLSPLQECDFTDAYKDRGFHIWLSDIPAEDFSPLSSIQRLESLDLNNRDSALWAPALENTEVYGFWGADVFHDNESFAAFIAAHPELEQLNIPWNEAVTDLSPVLSLDHLQHLRVSENMQAALEPVMAANPGFEIEIQN